MSATKVNTCTVSDCAYNKGQSCHAMGITIDNPTKATCATFTPATNGVGGMETVIASIGACKATSCVNNKGMMCSADSVKIGMSEGKVSCLSYSEG